MKIEYFLKNGVLDNRALDGGVYVVDLLNDNSKEVIHLYVGEAACIVNRCGKHLMEFSKNTRYFGIKKKYKNNKEVIKTFYPPNNIEKNIYLIRNEAVEKYKKMTNILSSYYGIEKENIIIEH